MNHAKKAPWGVVIAKRTNALRNPLLAPRASVVRSKF
jgi:hypothetical protein